MKSFLQRVLLVSTLIVLGAACGKDKGGSKGSTAVNPLGSYNLDTTQAQTLANLQAWYVSTTEGNYGTPGTGFTASSEKRRIKVYSANGGCTSKPVKVFGAQIGTFQSCSSSNAVQSSSDVTNPITPIVNGASKASNARLAAVFNGSLGTITSATSQATAYGGVIYTIMIVNQTTGLQYGYVIDTSINSALNPVYIMDYSTRTENSLISIL